MLDSSIPTLVRVSVAVAANVARDESERFWSRAPDDMTLCPSMARISFSVFIGVLEKRGLRSSRVAFWSIMLMTTLFPSES